MLITTPSRDPQRESPATQPRPRIRIPRAADAVAVCDLVERCPPLDHNSLYCYLLQCTQFAQTSAVAVQGEEVVGFVSGHRLPRFPQTLFVWQVAVAAECRGTGLAKEMIFSILKRSTSADITSLNTTVTAENGPSLYMFSALARRLATKCRRSKLFDKTEHFGGRFPTEFLLDIGPFESPRRIRKEKR